MSRSGWSGSAQDQVADDDQPGQPLLGIRDVDVGDQPGRLVAAQEIDGLLGSGGLRQHGQRRLHHLPDGVFLDAAQRTLDLCLQVGRQVGADVIDENLRQLGENRRDALRRFL